MSYKSILVHVDTAPQAPDRFRVAALLAAAFEAHLIGVASTGLPAAFLLHGGFGEGTVDIAPLLAQRRESAASALAAFGSAVEGHGAAARETRMVDDETGVALCMHAPYSDLIMVSQCTPDAPPSFERDDVPQYVVLHARRPALILPHAGLIGEIGKRILVAWDASPAATRAVHDALPLLQRAANVEVLFLRPEHPSERQGEQPETDLAQYLARHGVSVTASQAAAAPGVAVGEALLAHAARTNADMLVMGGYGHSRLRELVMGGATRSVLRAMTLPVLMSH